jgi:phage-related minor tail protein
MGFFVMVVGFLVAIAFLIYASLELRRASISFRDFLKDAGERLNPLLDETEKTLKSLRKVTDEVGMLTESSRNFAVALDEIAENARAVSSVITDLRGGISLRAVGVKAGLRAALQVLGHEIKKKPFGRR